MERNEIVREIRNKTEVLRLRTVEVLHANPEANIVHTSSDVARHFELDVIANVAAQIQALTVKLIALDLGKTEAEALDWLR